MSLSVLHYSGLSLISLLDSLSGSYFTINLSSFPETETVCQSSCLLFQQVMGPGAIFPGLVVIRPRPVFPEQDAIRPRLAFPGQTTTRPRQWELTTTQRN